MNHLKKMVMSLIYRKIGDLMNKLEDEALKSGFVLDRQPTKQGFLFSIRGGEHEIALGSIHVSSRRKERNIWVGLPKSTDLQHFRKFDGRKFVIIVDEINQHYVLLELLSIEKLRRFSSGRCFSVYWKDGTYKASDGLVVLTFKPINEEAELAEELYRFLLKP